MSESSSSSSDLAARCKALMANPDNMKTLLRGSDAERRELLAKHNLQGVNRDELRAALMASLGRGNASEESHGWMVNAAAAWINE